MGLFDFASDLTKIVVRTAALPVSIAKDVVTMGGALIDEDPATFKQIGKIVKGVEDLPDSIDKK